mmetsp:Transcript_105958/g.309904  ORF Transcript_105958/g.309904 Transcript_105958/m.309904 type:complete len:135 (-) Transcript_105958:58-462(-)
MGASPASCRCSGRPGEPDPREDDGEDNGYETTVECVRGQERYPVIRNGLRGGGCTKDLGDAEVVVTAHSAMDKVILVNDDDDDNLVMQDRGDKTSDDEAGGSDLKMGRPTVLAARVHQLKVLSTVCCTAAGCRG